MREAIRTQAEALFDGGWRHGDRDQLITEYQFSNSEVDLICRELDHIDSQEGRECEAIVAAEIGRR